MRPWRNPSLQFPATAVDDTNSLSLVLSSVHAGSDHHAFEFGVPAGSWLAVTPRVGRLAPGQSLRLQLDFSPPAAALQAGPPTGAAAQQAVGEAQAAAAAAPAAAAAAGTAATAEIGAAADRKGSSGDGQRQHSWREWVLPCYIKRLGDAAAGMGDDGTGPAAPAGATSPGGCGGGALPLVLHLVVGVCAVPQELALDPPGSLLRPRGKNYYEVRPP